MIEKREARKALWVDFNLHRAKSNTVATHGLQNETVIFLDAGAWLQ